MGMMAVNRLKEGGAERHNTIGGQTAKEKEAMRAEIEQRKQEAEHVSCPAICVSVGRELMRRRRTSRRYWRGQVSKSVAHEDTVEYPRIMTSPGIAA